VKEIRDVKSENEIRASIYYICVFRRHENYGIFDVFGIEIATV
jgi:hypothetical protein